MTKDLNRAHRVIHQLEAGICWINAWGESDAKMPVGGYKQSGVGRENGISSLNNFTRIKSVQVELGRLRLGFLKPEPCVACEAAIGGKPPPTFEL